MKGLRVKYFYPTDRKAASGGFKTAYVDELINEFMEENERAEGFEIVSLNIPVDKLGEFAVLVYKIHMK